MSWLMAALPPSARYGFARTIGAAVYYLWPERRRIARENFSRVLDKPVNNPEVGEVARESLQNFCRYLVDVMLYPKVSIEEMESRVQFHIDDEAAKALRMNSPAIICSAHFGNMDYVAAVAAKQYRHFTLAAETITPIELFEYLGRIRSKRGVDLIPYDRAPMKMLRALRHKEFLGFMMDFGINAHKDINTVPVTFFGERTNFPASAAILSR